MKKLILKIVLTLSILSIGLTGIPFDLFSVSGEQVLAEAKTLDLEKLPDNITIPEVDERRLSEIDKNIQEDNYTDMNELTKTEKENFIQAVIVETELAGLPTEEDKEVYKQALIDLFDSNSEVYNDVEATTEQVIEGIDENHSSPFDFISGDDVLALRIRISNKIVGSGINLAISLMIGGVGSAGVKALIRKFGTQRAINLINQKVVGVLTVWGIKQIVGVNFIAQLVSTTVKNVLDPGGYIAKQLDSRDKYRNNGYVDF